jgi:hypothetical protein
MTYEEAKQLVAECGLNIEGEKHEEVLNLVVEALDKQIPKKPFFFECPKCYSDDISCMDLMDFGEIKRKHCPNCGQALDWNR